MNRFVSPFMCFVAGVNQCVCDETCAFVCVSHAALPFVSPKSKEDRLPSRSANFYEYATSLWQARTRDGVSIPQTCFKPLGFGELLALLLNECMSVYPFTMEHSSFTDH